MARCRIGYLLALLGAALFHISFTDYFSFYVLVLTLVFPLFSLLVSLPGLLGTRVCLAVSARAIRRGGSALLTLTAKNRWRLPVGRIAVQVHCHNQMTGDRLLFYKKGYGGALGLTLEAEVECNHCGNVACSVSTIQVCDLLGLFSRKLPTPPPLDILSLPLDLPPEEVVALLGEGDNARILRPRPGGGPGEEYDLRPYRTGDPLRSVHWKLSSKKDELVVRETLEPLKVSAVLTYDHWGELGTLDAVFDRLDAVSRALIARERPHHIQWVDPLSGALHSHSIATQTDLRAFEHMAFSTLAPKCGPPSSAPTASDSGGLVRHLHITLPVDTRAGEEA